MSAWSSSDRRVVFWKEFLWDNECWSLQALRIDYSEDALSSCHLLSLSLHKTSPIESNWSSAFAFICIIYFYELSKCHIQMPPRSATDRQYRIDVSLRYASCNISFINMPLVDHLALFGPEHPNRRTPKWSVYQILSGRRLSAATRNF